ncbi:TPA: YscQ/HrcQ family type III secretion apparatus protein [Providencia rettgeri]
MSLRLKKIGQNELLLSSAASIWQRQGLDVTIGFPSKHGQWIKCGDSQRLWEGWILLTDWLEAISPELAKLAISAKAEKHIVHWLVSKRRPFEFSMPELGYEQLWFDDVISGEDLPDKALLRILSSNGPIWIEKIPKIEPEKMPIVPSNLSWPISLSLGYSLVQLKTLEQIEPGDVLLIQNRLSEVSCYTQKLGLFQYVDGGVIMESQNFNEVEETYSDVSTVDSIQKMGMVPVKMEFILHRKNLSLSELQCIYEGQVLSLPNESETRVEVRVNDVLLGYGELVQLDDSLGVEITKWLDESK